jgi:hypothetical protein
MKVAIKYGATSFTMVNPVILIHLLTEKNQPTRLISCTITYEIDKKKIPCELRRSIEKIVITLVVNIISVISFVLLRVISNCIHKILK